ncbi:MAG: ribonuclease H [bacterium]|nr:ribonuclease H [bacterium]
MEKLLLFIDGSVNTKSKIGYGAYLAVNETELSLDILKAKVKVKRFEQTSSTKLELQNLLWSLGDTLQSNNKVIIYTDSQNIISLPERRNRLEENDYRSKKNRLLNNHELYQEFYNITDQMNCEFIKVVGHKPSNQKNNIDRIFTLVDRASRNALRINSQ